MLLERILLGINNKPFTGIKFIQGSVVELVDAPHSKCGTFGFVGSSPTAPIGLMNTYRRFPLTIVRGKGCWVWDHTGKRYLDAVAGIATCSLGHSDNALRRALTKQLNKIQHVSNLYHIPEQEELADWLVNHSCADKVFFCNSGAEANEAAIKLARKFAFYKRGINDPVILTAQASFHGRTLAALSATGQERYHEGFQPLVKGFKFFEYNNYHSFESLLANVEKDGPRVAAVLIEPLQGEGGVIPGSPHFFKKLKEKCSKQNILLIFDEVQTGVGRSGFWWGYEWLGIEPDALTVAKGLGGGHAIGALMIQNCADIFKPGDHASTFGGNPFACKAGLTVGMEINRRELLQNVKKRGYQLGEGLQKLVKIFPKHLKETRGVGLIQGLEILQDSPLTASKLAQTALDHQLLVVSAGPKVVRMVPPLVIKENEIKQLLQKLELSFRDCC